MMKFKNPCLIFWTTLAFPLIAFAGDWPQFRGPGGSAVSPETGLPTKWSKTENIRWKAELPGRGLSCPVVADGRVFLTCSSGVRQDRLHVLCFDAASGKKLWERQLWATGGTNCHPKTCMAAPTPATDGKFVYALFATADLACLDADGNLKWYRSLVGDYPDITNQVGMAASPILCKDTLLVPMENVGPSFVAGIDVKTGKNRWKAERLRDINWATPHVTERNGKAEALFMSADNLTAYDPHTGAKRWVYESKGLSTVPTLAEGNGMLFIPAGEFLALSLKDKKPPELVWKSNRLRTTYGSPIYHERRLYAVNGANVLNCAEAKDGNNLWQLRLKGPFSSSPVIADGKLYVANEEGMTTVVKLGDKPEILATNELGEVLLATPAISGGAIYLRSDQHLFCIDD